VYTPGANDAINGTVTLTLTASGNNPCPDAISDIIVTIHPLATAFAGEDAEIKEYETYNLSGALVQNSSSVVWTTSGDGTFDNANTANPTYTPGVNDKTTGEAVLTIEAISENCGNVSDQMTLGVNPSGIYENLAGFNVTVSPNPSNGNFMISLKGDRSEEISIRIYNSLSKLVYESEIIMVDREFQKTLQLNLEKGIYLININGKELRLNKKLIIK
jgi:hypothetical protein